MSAESALSSERSLHPPPPEGLNSIPEGLTGFPEGLNSAPLQLVGATMSILGCKGDREERSDQSKTRN